MACVWVQAPERDSLVWLAIRMMMKDSYQSNFVLVTRMRGMNGYVTGLIIIVSQNSNVIMQGITESEPD